MKEIRVSLAYTVALVLLIAALLFFTPLRFRQGALPGSLDDWHPKNPSGAESLLVPTSKEVALHAYVDFSPDKSYYFHLRSNRKALAHVAFAKNGKRSGPRFAPNPIYSDVVSWIDTRWLLGPTAIHLNSRLASPVEIESFQIFSVPKWLAPLRFIAGCGVFLLSMILTARIGGRKFLIAICLLFGCSLVYYNYVMWWNSADNKRYIMTSASLANEGNLDLSEYVARLAEPHASGFHKPRGRETVYNYFPLGPSIAAAPVVVWGALTQMDEVVVEHVVAAIFAALSVALLFLIALQYGLSTSAGVMLSLVFAFASTHLPMNASDLWSHNISACVAFGLIYILGFPGWKTVLLAGFLAGFGYVVRPDFSVIILGGLAIVLVQRPRQIFAYLIPVVLVIGTFVVVIKITHNQWLPPYYGANRLVLNGAPERLLGQLFSPSRGLFFHNPILLLLPLSCIAILKTRTRQDVVFVVIAIVSLLSLIAIGGFPKWWGGYGFGPRLHAGIIGLLFMLLIPGIKWVLTMSPFRQKAIGSFAILAIGAGLLINSTASLTLNLPIWTGPPLKVRQWNNFPVSVDEAPERCWDWSDIQFMRRFREAPVAQQ